MSIKKVTVSRVIATIQVGNEVRNLNLRTHDERKVLSLPENTFFVFGSNEAGVHGAGAAFTAHHFFDAVRGVGYGITGQSFAIPTKNRKIQKLSNAAVNTYIERFIDSVFDGDVDAKFFLTEVGCGLAGFEIKEIADMFFDAIFKNVGKSKYPNIISNIYFPISFIDAISSEYHVIGTYELENSTVKE